MKNLLERGSHNLYHFLKHLSISILVIHSLYDMIIKERSYKNAFKVLNFQNVLPKKLPKFLQSKNLSEEAFETPTKLLCEKTQISNLDYKLPKSIIKTKELNIKRNQKLFFN